MRLNKLVVILFFVMGSCIGAQGKASFLTAAIYQQQILVRGLDGETYAARLSLPLGMVLTSTPDHYGTRFNSGIQGFEIEVAASFSQSVSNTNPGVQRTLLGKTRIEVFTVGRKIWVTMSRPASIPQQFENCTARIDTSVVQPPQYVTAIKRAANLCQTFHLVSKRPD